MNSLPNESSYTLATVHHPDTDESTSLLSSSSPSYGSAPVHTPHHTRRIIFNATCKMALGTLLHIPKSFADLKDLNYLLKKYRDIYPFRVFLSYVLTYFLSVPFLVLLRSRSDHPS